MKVGEGVTRSSVATATELRGEERGRVKRRMKLEFEA
jgi:hypothetical protein